MLTLNQKIRLNYLTNNSIENIRDISLLSLACPKPQFRAFPIVYIPFSPLFWRLQKPTKIAIFLPGIPIQYKHVQTSFLKHFMTLDKKKKIHFVRACLLQVAKMLSNMDYYVHGDLTVANIMISLVGDEYQFYITDKCIFNRKKYLDLRTLYISILELYEEPFPNFFPTFKDIDVFDPIVFIKHIESI